MLSRVGFKALNLCVHMPVPMCERVFEREGGECLSMKVVNV